VKDGLQGCLPCKNLQHSFSPSGQQYQIVLYLVQIGGEWTWESKGAKHQGIKDRGQKIGNIHYFIIYRWIVPTPSSCLYMY